MPKGCITVHANTQTHGLGSNAPTAVSNTAKKQMSNPDLSLTTSGWQPWKSDVTAEDDKTQSAQLLPGRSEMVPTGMTNQHY